MYDGRSLRIRRSRGRLLEEIQGAKFFAEVPEKTFSKLPLPPVTKEIVSAISSARHADFNLVFLAWLGTVALANHGRASVYLPGAGIKSPLSLLLMVGAESGTGKSAATVEFLDFFKKIDEKILLHYEELNAKIAVDNRVRVRRMRELCNSYMRTGNPEQYEKMLQAEKEKKTKLVPPCFTLSELTSAAYSQRMASQGFVGRIDPEGIPLPKGAMDQLRKYWSGEPHAQDRISRGQTVSYNPAIIDVTFTQLGPFQALLHDQEANNRGLIARMLVYRHLPDEIVYRHERYPLSDEIRQRMENVLSRIIGALDAVHEKACFSMELSHDAEQFWNSENELWMQELRNWEELWKIEEWVKRIGEHALRIAGILHLAEYSDPEISSIDESEIRLAFDILDVFAHHMQICARSTADEREQACARDVALWILEHNVETFIATQLKQRLKSSYRASEIDVALYCLEQHGIIVSIGNDITLRRRGRPRSCEYRNLYFQPSLI
ncbi:DUF3987 domain-containing protein [Bilophila wadsworthia]